MANRGFARRILYHILGDMMASSGAVYETQVRYATFWERFGAFIIDSVIVTVIGIVVGAVFGGFMGGYMGARGASPEEISNAAVLPGYIIGMFINFIYYTAMESSARQATFGKSAVGLIVTDLNGNRISFGQATGRYLGKIISGLMLGIGYIIIGFTDRKQGLHDIMAQTLVVRK